MSAFTKGIINSMYFCWTWGAVAEWSKALLLREKISEILKDPTFKGSIKVLLTGILNSKSNTAAFTVIVIVLQGAKICSVLRSVIIYPKLF